jgi:molecular chaperone DnaK
MIAIDLGTTSARAAAVVDGRPVVITNAVGDRSTPSVVAFTSSGERLVGQPARSQAARNPANTVCWVERLLGRSWMEVQDERPHLPYSVEAGSHGHALIAVPATGRRHTPEQILAVLLRQLRACPASRSRSTWTATACCWSRPGIRTPGAGGA